MIRRIAAGIGALAVIGGAAIAIPAVAHAANGTITINGITTNNPSGCFASNRWPLSVTNNTDEVAIVFEGSNCTGQPLEMVAPSNGTVSEFGGSVYVP